jgi:hypothetical protein
MGGGKGSKTTNELFLSALVRRKCTGKYDEIYILKAILQEMLWSKDCEMWNQRNLLAMQF